jgi:hypothetical protein
MKTLKQSPTLKATFQKKIDDKKTAKHQEIHEVLGDSGLSKLGSLIYESKYFW